MWVAWGLTDSSITKSEIQDNESIQQSRPSKKMCQFSISCSPYEVRHKDATRVAPSPQDIAVCTLQR